MAQYQYERVLDRIRQDEEDKEKENNRSGWDKFWGGAGDVAKGVGGFVGDVLQGIPRGVANIGLTLQEGSRNMNLDGANANIERIKKIDPDRRQQLLKDFSDPEKSKNLSDQDWADAFILKKANDELGGVDDETLDKRRKSNEDEKKTHLTYKADNDFMKFLIGGEEDEVAQSAQKTNEDIKNWGEDQGMTSGQAGALGFAGAVGLTALDAPTGIGSLIKTPVKQLGKEGIKKLAGETSEDVIGATLREVAPGISDDAVRQLTPALANASDDKTVRRILDRATNRSGKITDKRATRSGTRYAPTDTINTPVTGSIDDVVEGVADNAGAIDDVEDVVSSAATGGGRQSTRYAGEEDMDAVDELLGRVKSTSQLDKKKKKFGAAMKEQFVDKLSPVNDLVKTIEAKTGRKLTTEDNPYELMRLYNGMPDMVQQRVSQLTNILKESPDLDAVKTIGLARQIRGRSQRGISSFVTEDTANRAVQQWYNKLGQEGFDRAEAVVDAVQQYNKGLLDDLHEAGIISDDALRAIQETGADYFARFNVIDYIMKSDTNRALFSKTGSYNTTKQTLNKILAGAKGMEEGTEILDPIESIVKSTDATMRAVAKNQIWHAFDRLADEVPELIVRTRDPDNVAERIALSLDNKELRPIRNKLDRMISTRQSWVRRLESQVNKLNKQGLSKALREGGERMTQETLVDPARLGGSVPTSQIGREGATTVRQGDETVRGFMDMVNPQKLGARDTGAFVRNLIEKGSRSDIDKIKKMIGNRDEKLVKLLDDIGTMKSEYDDVAARIFSNREEIAKRADLDVPEGMAAISGFGRGIQGKLAVPEEIADVFTGKTKAQQDYLTSVISNINSFVKQNFTSNNLAFALFTNPVRDFKTFAYNSKNVKADPISIFKAYTQGLMGRVFRDADYKKMIEAGGKSGFYADERTADRMARDMVRTISGKRVLGVKVAPVHTAKDFIREAGRVVLAPLRVARDTLHGTASILEDAPRLAEFKAAQRGGKTAQQAAFDARNVTVDFQQSGRVGQVLNAWIPFLNARFQGVLKSGEAVKNNPARAAMVYATMSAAPIWLSQANNMRFPEVMKNIPDEERANNFIVVLGDEQDEDGNYTQVIKVPKSDVDKILGNPMEQIARFVYDDDPATFQETLINMVGNTLPFDTVRDGEFSLERTVGSLTPPVLKAPIEAATNRNMYFGSDIVPENLQDLPANEQVKGTESAVGSFLGNLTGTSPLIADNTLRSFTGNLLTKAPQDQLAGKVMGASNNKMNDEFYSTLDKTRKNRASASNYINEAIARGDIAAAQQTAQRYNQYLIEAFTPFGQTYGNQMTQELADIYEEQKIILTRRSVRQRQRNQLEREAAGQ